MCIITFAISVLQIIEMMLPPEEYGDFTENIDDFMEDEEALEAMREMENERLASPDRKRIKLDSKQPAKQAEMAAQRTLDDITNINQTFKDYRFVVLYLYSSVFKNCCDV